jgi:hypothetical protein
MAAALACQEIFRIILRLCEEPNTAETVYPGTNLRMIYAMPSTHDPSRQEVLKFIIKETFDVPASRCLKSS